MANACYCPTPVRYKRKPRLLSSIRILVVDDHEGWRRRVCQLLQVRPKFQVIGEASDGSEAIQKAEDLKPDLILLDIGLPKLKMADGPVGVRNYGPSTAFAGGIALAAAWAFTLPECADQAFGSHSCWFDTTDRQ